MKCISGVFGVEENHSLWSGASPTGEGGGGQGCPAPPTFVNRVRSTPHFLRCNRFFFFSLNFIKIKRIIKLFMLMKNIPLKDEI